MVRAMEVPPVATKKLKRARRDRKLSVQLTPEDRRRLQAFADANSWTASTAAAVILRRALDEAAATRAASA